MGLVMGIVCLAVSVLVYAPFVIAASKAAQMNDSEKELGEGAI